MKKLIAFVLFLHLAFYVGAQEKKQYKVGLIGFYNLENLFDTIDDPNKNDNEFLPEGVNRYTGKVYLDKLSKLEEVVSQIGTDISPDGLSIIGCAEVENTEVLQDLSNQPRLKARQYKVVHYNSPDDRSVDVALLYNPKYFNPTHSEPLFVDLKNDDGTPRYTRDVLYVSGMYNGEKLHIFVNHWPSRRGGEEASAPGRAKAAGVVRQKTDSINKIDPQAKIIIMGDLNDDPTSPSVTEVLGSVGDMRDVKEKGLYNPWVSYYQEGIGTLAYNDSWNLFDQIIISQPWLEKKQNGFFFKEARIFKKEFMIQKTGRYKGYPMRTYDFNRYVGGYSDHFPTYLVLLKEIK